MWTISDLKLKAKQVLNQGYWKAVLVALIMTFAGSSGGSGSAGSGAGNAVGELANGNEDALIALLAIGIVLLLVFLFIGIFAIGIQVFLLNPLKVGCRRYFVLACMQDTNLGEMGFSFKSGRYGNTVKGMFLVQLYTFLWSLLLVIPGIIKSYEYRMVEYLLAENPNMEVNEAFSLSREMMNGEKFNAFMLDLSFIGWHILSVFTCGILSLLYVGPYEALTGAQLYLALRPKVASPAPANDTEW